MSEFTLVGKKEHFAPLPELIDDMGLGPAKIQSHGQLHPRDAQGEILILSLEDPRAISVMSRAHLFTGCFVAIWGDRGLFDQRAQALKKALPFIAGLLDRNSSSLEWLCQLSTLANLAKTHQLAERLSFVGEEFGKLAESASSSTEKLKKIHEKLIPIKRLQHQGVRVLSSFAPGPATGGELYDVFLPPQKDSINVVWASSPSHLTLANLIEQWGLLKKEGDFEDVLGDYLDALNSDGEGSFCSFCIRPSKMAVRGAHFGGGCLYLNGKGIESSCRGPWKREFIGHAQLGLQLNRGDELLATSEGLEALARQNKLHIPDLLKRASSKEGLFSEIFYQLKKNRPGKFLERDVVLISIEISENAIFEV